MFPTSYFLEEGNKEKKRIAAIKQRWEDKYPNKYVFNQACASNILADIKSYVTFISRIYRAAHGILTRDEYYALLDHSDTEWCSNITDPSVIAKFIETLTQGKYDGTSLRGLAIAAKKSPIFDYDYDMEHITFDEIVDALTTAQDISLISHYIAQPLHKSYRKYGDDAPNPKFVKLFIDNGGNELMDALYNGCTVEDIISQ